MSKQFARTLGTTYPHLKKNFLRTIFVYAAQVVEFTGVEVSKELPESIKKGFMSTYEFFLGKDEKKKLMSSLKISTKTALMLK